MTNRPTLAQFQDLSRDDMVDEIRQRHPALAKGMTRAKKESLINIWRRVLTEELGELLGQAAMVVDNETRKPADPNWNKIQVQLVSGGPLHTFDTHEEALAWLETQKTAVGLDAIAAKGLEKVVLVGDMSSPAMHAAHEHLSKAGVVLVDSPEFREANYDRRQDALDRALPPALLSGVPVESIIMDEIPAQKHQGVSMSTHVHGPGCGHDHTLPAVAGMNDLVRVNPELPVMPFQDGAIIPVPAEQSEPDYVLKDSEQKELTPKQSALIDRFRSNFNTFCRNPQDSGARREAKDAIYRLGVAGVVLHPRFDEMLADGARRVREFVKKEKLGVSAVAAAAAPEKTA